MTTTQMRKHCPGSASASSAHLFLRFVLGHASNRLIVVRYPWLTRVPGIDRFLRFCLAPSSSRSTALVSAFQSSTPLQLLRSWLLHPRLDVCCELMSGEKPSFARLRMSCSLERETPALARPALHSSALICGRIRLRVWLDSC